MWQGLKTEGAKRIWGVCHRLQPENASKKQKNRRKNFPLEWNAIWPQDTWKGSQFHRFCLFWQASKVTTFYWTEYMKRMSDRIVSKFSKPELKWNWGADQVVQNKTKWMCVCFFCRVWHVATKKIGFIADYWFLPSQGWYFKTSHWCKNDRSIRKRMFGTLHRRWVELWPWASLTADCRSHQFPSSINECSFQKEWGFKLLKQSQQVSNCCEAIFETKDGEAHCELLLWISFSPICSFATDNQTTN